MRISPASPAAGSASPRSAADNRGRASLLRGHPRPRRGPQATLSRALLARRHLARGGRFLKSLTSLHAIEGGDDDPPPAGRSPSVDFPGARRGNATHRSRTDPDARLAKIKGKEAKLCHQGHVLAENRNGLIVAVELTQATGRAEREGGLLHVDVVVCRLWNRHLTFPLASLQRDLVAAEYSAGDVMQTTPW